MLKLATIVLALAAIAVPASAAVADGLAAPYLHIQVALANDSTDGVAEAARTIAAEAAGMGEQAAAIGATAATSVASANIGCVLHMRQQLDLPVDHWLEICARHLLA